MTITIPGSREPPDGLRHHGLQTWASGSAWLGFAEPGVQESLGFKTWDYGIGFRV